MRDVNSVVPFVSLSKGKKKKCIVFLEKVMEGICSVDAFGKDRK